MKRAKVGVVGLTGQSAFLTVERFADPGETISCGSLMFEPGGKGHNQAVACSRMGVDVVFIGAVGNDPNGQMCKAAIESEGVRTSLVYKDIPTAYAVIQTEQSGENTVAVYPGAAGAMKKEDLFSKEIYEELSSCQYLLVQNELPQECLEAVFTIAKTFDQKVIFNPAPASNIREEFLRNSELITPNYEEAKKLAGLSEQTNVSDEELQQIFAQKKIKKAIVTLGGKGVLVITPESCYRIPAFRSGIPVDTTGAGDTFNGVLTGALVLGMNFQEAVKVAVVAAGISVTRRGAVKCIPYFEEITNAAANFET